MSFHSPTSYSSADSHPQCGAGRRCGCGRPLLPDPFSLACHGAGSPGWADLHLGSHVPAGKELGNEHLLLWLPPGSRPLEHGGPSCSAKGCIRQPLAPSQFSFRAWVRDSPKSDGAFVKIWGASIRTYSSLLRNKGDLLEGYWGITEPQDRNAAGSPGMAGTRDASLVGNPRSPRSSFFAFPEHLLYSHSVDFLLLLLLHMVECHLSLQESSQVKSLGPSCKFFGEGAPWSNLDNVPIFGWVGGKAHHTCKSAVHEPCEWGWEGQHSKEGCWADNPGHVHF